MSTQTTTRQRMNGTPDIVAVMAAHGIALTGAGPEMKGRCPFHEDDTPSLSVNRDKGVWHCFGCGAKGNAKVFLARMSGHLTTGRDLPPRADLRVGGGTASTPGAVIEKVVKPAKTNGGGGKSETVADVGAVIERVVTLYHEALSRNKAALEYLSDKRGLGDMELLRRYRVGFADGSLRKLAPPRSAVWNTLRALGYLNDRGGEYFAGRIVFPITDAAGAVVGMYGRAVSERQGVVAHLNARGPHRGVWNREGARAAAASGLPVLVCESVIDALSCVAVGYPGAVALYGTGGVTADHIELFREIRPRRIVLALDGDKGGRDAVPPVLEKFAGLAPEFAIARLPEEKELKDPNAVMVQMGAAALRDFIERAKPERLSPAATGCRVSQGAETITPPRPVAVLAAATESAPVLSPEQSRGVEGPAVSESSGVLVEESGGDLRFECAARVYHVKNFTAFGFARMRATLLLANKADGAVYIDTLDLYSNRARAAFVSEAGARLGLDAETIERDLLSMTLALDEHRRREAEKLQGRPRIEKHVMTPEEKAAGMEFLTSENLIAGIVRDCEAAGYVGEADNKALAYLIATSRKMREPLSAILIASSGAGKSALLDVVETLVPPEDLYAVSDMSDNALFYIPNGDLSQKLLIIAERNGSEGADYSLRELQTKRSITKAVSVKDPETGRIKTILVTVRGPVAVMESTTNPRMNPENANRCFVLHCDESREQTEAIQQAQRRAKSLTGFERDAARENVIMRHQAAQRLLEPLRVIIPFAEKITFPADTVRTRRDHARFLNLIEAVAFLHQKKRPAKESNGRAYIEATLDDYETARGLALEVLTANLDELPRASRALLDAMEAHVSAQAKRRDAVLFSRDDLMKVSGFSYAQIRNAIGPLWENDLVTLERGARGMALYRLGTKFDRPVVHIPTSAEISGETK